MKSTGELNPKFNVKDIDEIIDRIIEDLETLREVIHQLMMG